jgi:hypothetical protein
VFDRWEVFAVCCWQNQPFRPPGLKEQVKQNQI